jgi:hypothetical protein
VQVSNVANDVILWNDGFRNIKDALSPRTAGIIVRERQTQYAFKLCEAAHYRACQRLNDPLHKVCHKASEVIVSLDDTNEQPYAHFHAG